MVPDNMIYDPPQLCQFIRDHRITRQLFTPSLFETLIEYNLPNIKGYLQSLRYVDSNTNLMSVLSLAHSLPLLPLPRSPSFSPSFSSSLIYFPLSPFSSSLPPSLTFFHLPSSPFSFLFLLLPHLLIFLPSSLLQSLPFFHSSCLYFSRPFLFLPLPLLSLTPILPFISTILSLSPPIFDLQTPLSCVSQAGVVLRRGGHNEPPGEVDDYVPVDTVCQPVQYIRVA